MKHAKTIRGLLDASNRAVSPLASTSTFEGKFGRMFPELPPAEFTPESLESLAKAMEADGEALKDAPDSEESGIPALYTYLGQFVDHDLTFDPASIEQTTRDVEAIVDYRTPAFDLDCVYGRGPDDQPYFYSDNKFFLTGYSLQGGTPNAVDVPRNAIGRALIGDPRNDENAIVTQLQGLFLRHHNRLVSESLNAADPFEFARQQLRFRYQRMLLTDFLPRIVDAGILGQFQECGRFSRENVSFAGAFMPIEFAGAAYRLGHSMVRPGYRLNDQINLSIFPGSRPDQKEGLTGFRALNTNWALDWGRFIDIDTREYGDPDDTVPLPANLRRLQFAYRLDTSIVNPLANLPENVARNPSSLILRNLQRGWRLGLPSGQAVADFLQVRKLTDEEILIGKFSDKPEVKNILEVDPTLAGNCPLWTYILAETFYYQENKPAPVLGEVSINTPKLGPVGGYIVASVFLGLMFNDPSSLLNADEATQSAIPEIYTLKDFVNYALGR